MLAFWLHDAAEPALADSHGAPASSISSVTDTSAANGGLPLNVAGSEDQGSPVHAVLLCAALLLAVGLTVAVSRPITRGQRVPTTGRQTRNRGFGRVLAAPPPHTLGLLRI